MTNLSKLKTSLTKHGAHKISSLLKKFDKDNILNNLSGSVPGINIEEVQAKKNLSYNNSSSVPQLWNDAKAYGNDTVDALVLIAIVFSHHSLIEAMSGSTTTTPFTGLIKRGTHLDGKAYTNFAHTLDELGFATSHTSDEVIYDLSKIFELDQLNIFTKKLLTLKLMTANWGGHNTFIDEVKSLDFHRVFSITSDQFENWINTGQLESTSEPEHETEQEQEQEQHQVIDDLDFFTNSAEPETSTTFVFVKGHNSKKTGSISVSNMNSGHTVNLVHNEIQNQLYNKLVKEFGETCVGTEVGTGDGTSIDLVVNTPEFTWFYEIKTAETVKSCIRQAIPQLLEYAYWKTESNLADKLIIVSENEITTQSEQYLNRLRNQFNLPIHYEQFKLSTS